MPTLLTNCVTQQDMIDFYGFEEILELTNLCDELADTINTTKLQAALDAAHGILNSRYLIAGDCGRALIKTSCQSIIYWICRYLMDQTKSRPMVNEDYDHAMALLDYACKECIERCPLSAEEITDILGEDAVPTRSRLRCYSGGGNRFNTFAPRIKVDTYIDSNSRYYNYLIDNYFLQ